MQAADGCDVFPQYWRKDLVFPVPSSIVPLPASHVPL